MPPRRSHEPVPVPLPLDVEVPGDLADAARRLEVIARAKAYSKLAHITAEEILCSHGGLAAASYLSQAQDEVIQAFFRFITQGNYQAHNPTLGERIAICAVGGYGRGTLAPGSDVDLLILYATQTAWNESVAEALLYMLWDLGLKVGHATRTISECMKGAKEDMTIRTALLEARLISGDVAIFDAFWSRFDWEIMNGTGAEFTHAKLEERDERIKKAGTSRYLVEPNVKEGKGGLRDLNTLFWIAKYVYHVRNVDELVSAGLFSRHELVEFKRCEEFLWRVRCHLHFVTGRAEERLSFEMQRQLAERMGYHATSALSKVERFMKHYFLVAKQVGDLTAIVCAALEEREAKPTAMLDRFMGSFQRRRRKLKGESDFVVENGRITYADASIFANNPNNLIRIFALADTHNLAIHPDANYLIARSLKLIDAGLRADPRANALFLGILTSENAPEVVLRHMHETGVLGRFIPEFGRINAMMQFSMYHHYTVDEHTLRAVGILSELQSGRLKEQLPLTTEVLPGISNTRVLRVAIFLHDIGKGYSADHSIVGRDIARMLCPRLGLSEGETETVAWLVEHHLDMSVVSQTRDVGDPATIRAFAALVQTLERLKLLLTLTVCDIRAVGPNVWNGWKGQLLRSLYWETEIELAGGHSVLARGDRVRQAQEELRAQLTGWSDAAFAKYAQLHYPAYWFKVDLAHKLKHAALLADVEAKGERFATATATDAFGGITELTVFAIDHPRLLAILTGACAAAGANIVGAQIFTTTNGRALDTIAISRAFDRDDDELRRAERVAAHIVRALKGEIALPEVIALRAAQTTPNPAFAVVPSVTLDNTLSDRFTVVEVTGLDRPGLLYELTTALGKLSLNIASARIVTYGEKAVDVFYVTDLTGGQIVNASRQSAVKRRILEVFGVGDEVKT
ncbi:MAG: [protein-PII] uridylyltransferase [Beijerinckiaceae bacterium]|nr:[protein-PII] uridylyltransferase [Beijerinckiaceae bacterium]